MNGNDDEYKAASRRTDPFALVLPEPRDSLPSRMFSKGPMHVERRGEVEEDENQSNSY